MIKKIVKAISHPSMTLCYLIECSHLFEGISDEKYLKMMWRIKFGTKLDLENPKTFTEKLQWLKLYDRKPEYTNLVDKYEVKKIVADMIGEKYIIPTLGVWDSVDEIEWGSLPQQFVLKTTHGSDSGGVVICKDKNTLDKKAAKKKLLKSMKSDVYRTMREWPYKNINKRIIAETYLTDLGTADNQCIADCGESQLKDYKFYCFDGEPKFMLIASNRFTTHNFNYYDMKFNKLPLTSAVGSQADVVFDKPDQFDEMKEIATILSQGFAHIRVDLYCSGGQVYFGELTFYDSSGYDDFSSEEWNKKCGDWIKLPEESVRCYEK
ncbi:MAG: glycosyl transferase [Bacteroidales bacterium]|nr:glycosyl transferase [Bacteroidales bacterium]